MRPGNRRGLAAAGLWGFAEASVFFIVPDVLLTFLAQTSLRRALLAGLAAAICASLGGAAVYGLALGSPDTAHAVLLAIPGISAELVARVADLLRSGLLQGLVAGSLSGAPYKIFAVEAATSGVPLIPFLLASLPARFLRFLLASLVSWLVFAKLLSGLALRTRRLLLAGFWLVFYAGYFAAMGW